MGYLINETTREEREQIVRDSLGNIEANCDGCMAGVAEMYQDYIEGKKELREINMAFGARYILRSRIQQIIVNLVKISLNK